MSWRRSVGQLDRIQRIELEIPLRGGVGCMRPAESDAHKKLLFFVNRLSNIVYCIAGNDSVRRLVVRCLQPFPINRVVAGAVRIAMLYDLVLVRTLAELATFDVPRARILKAFAGM